MRIPIASSTSDRGRDSRPNWRILAAFVGAALGVSAVAALFSPGVYVAAGHIGAGLFVIVAPWLAIVWTIRQYTKFDRAALARGRSGRECW
jgi:hypothetical protein